MPADRFTCGLTVRPRLMRLNQVNRIRRSAKEKPRTAQTGRGFGLCDQLLDAAITQCLKSTIKVYGVELLFSLLTACCILSRRLA